MTHWGHCQPHSVASLLTLQSSACSAKGLFQEGATVVLAVKTLSNLEKAIKEFQTMDGRTTAIQTDIIDEKQDLWLGVQS